MTRCAWLACFLLCFTLSTGCGQKGSTTLPGKQTEGGGATTNKNDTKPNNGGESDEGIAKEIEKLGGDIGRDPQGVIVGVALPGKPGAWKKALPYLKKLKQLRELELPEAGVTDADLKDLASLAGLESLNLDANRISGSGVKHLAGVKSLKILSLIRCGLRDADLSALASLPQLQQLQLANNPITNTGAKELSNLKNLTALNLIGTKVDDKGAAELKKALPKVKIAR